MLIQNVETDEIFKIKREITATQTCFRTASCNSTGGRVTRFLRSSVIHPHQYIHPKMESANHFIKCSLEL